MILAKRLFGPVAGLLTVLCVNTSADAAEKPNVVFILADDLGWRDTSVYGSTFYRTPNVDRLARRGMRFLTAYAANPLCSPTRASILTGQYPGRLRFTTPAGHLPQEVLDPKLPERGPPSQKAVTPQTRTRLPNTYVTFAEVLDRSGYATAFVGKWHLGRAPYLPDNQGFDVVVGGRRHPGPPGGYFAPWPIETIPESPEGAHISDVITTEAIRFIRGNKGRPFLLCLWFYDVHAPFEAKPELAEQYRGRIDPADPQRCPTMGAMIEVMDTNVGRVLDVLDHLGVADNTIIIFTSDNGGNMYSDVDGTVPTSNHPLRGGKASIYEGGTRVPAIVVWPGVVRANSTSRAVVSSIDYYPTILDMLRLKADDAQVIDGISIVPALEQQGALKRDAIFCHFPHYVRATSNLPATSVRQGDWKLIRFYADNDDRSDRFELYNLEQDVGESHNLAPQMPEKVAELDALIDRHLEATEPLVPVPNPAYRKSIAGWYGNRLADVTARAGRLVIESKGNDPFVQTGNVPAAARRAVLEIRMKSTGRGRAQVYWATRRHRAFHRDRSTIFDAVHDGQWHDYRVSLDVTSPLTALRIDPSQAPGTVEIELLRLLDAAGTVLKQWQF